MARDNNITRFVLDTWHILPDNKIHLNQLIRFLELNRNINIELNSYSLENPESQTNKIFMEKLSSIDASLYLLSEGIHCSRVILGHLAESNFPMFRFVKVI